MQFHACFLLPSGYRYSGFHSVEAISQGIQNTHASIKPSALHIANVNLYVQIPTNQLPTSLLKFTSIAQLYTDHAYLRC